MTRMPKSSPSSVADLFRSRFGPEPVGVWSAPGRVNLIGEHTDYNGGLVLPFAIDARASAAIGPGGTDRYRVASAQRSGTIATAATDALEPGTPSASGWQAYVFGVIWALREAGYQVPPLDIAVDSTVPAGAGLSSSAALECAVALSISDHYGFDLSRKELARLAQHAENDFVGMPCGLMDQMASMVSTAGHALYFDVGAGSIEQIPFAPHEFGLQTLVIDTRTHHALADGEYAKRRRDCEAAARALTLESLSDLMPQDLSAALARLDSDTLRRRVRHIVTENERVRAVTDMLRHGHLHDIGAPLSASHASLRDDYEVSCAELDLAAAAAERAGALGARMVGGGFGGSVIALVPDNHTRAVENGVIRAFAVAGFAAPTIWTVHPATGASRDH